MTTRYQKLAANYTATIAIACTGASHICKNTSSGSFLLLAPSFFLFPRSLGPPALKLQFLA
ncbi:hypothetical protein QUB05_23905 [Microcoleus sp. F10-C6]|uniref:hypothetical protein n=1 Tax=unclassified Microcoleus TaxID=2642155 RepID=UPI002FD3FB56